MMEDIVSCEDRKQYAELIAHLVAVDHGDVVLINTQFGYEKMIYTLVEACYKKGAKYVAVSIRDQYLNLIRAQHSCSEFLTYLPNNVKDSLNEFSDIKACTISLRSPLENGKGDGVSSQSLSILYKNYREHIQHYQQGVLSDRFTWIVAAYPTPEWGHNLFPDLPPVEAGRELWKHMRAILMFDKDDVVKAWENKIALIQKRKQYLDNKKYHALHFTGENTDWYVSLSKRSIWSGATHDSANGKRFQANVPTEETYTTPDCRFSYGTVKVQRPIEIFGRTIDNIVMTFKEGRVISASASVGNDVLQSFLQSDERNCYLGEIALVDINSLVWKSNLTFNNILFDENAGAHFALGSAYTTTYGIENDDKKESTDLLSIGCNIGSSHEDFTIGYEGLSVYGVYYNEEEEGNIAHKSIKSKEAIISNGLFVID